MKTNEQILSPDLSGSGETLLTSTSQDIGASPQTAEAKAGPRKSKRRNGKVARLSKTLRDKISLALTDGVPYNSIIESLGEEGQGITQNCISSYKNGGHQDWLREQQLLQQCRLRHELVFDLARQDSSIDAYTASNKLAAALICDAIAEIGSDSLRAAIQQNPLNLIRMLNSLSRLTLGGLRCEQHVSASQKKEIISLEDIERIEREHNLM